MKNLLPALVFLFPLAAHAEGIKDLPSEERMVLLRENLPSEERLRIINNCCTPDAVKSEPSILGELKPVDPWKQVMRKRRLQLYVIDPDKPELGRLSFERHQKMYGFWYRQEYGILDGSR